MDYYKLLTDIHQKRIPSVYLLAGEEPYLSHQLVQELEEVVLEERTMDFNYDLFDGEIVSIAEVLEAAFLLPVFAEKRLVVVKNAPWFSSKGKDKGEGFDEEGDLLLLEYLERPSPSTCLVFLTQGKLDRRRRVLKQVAKQGVVWESQALVGAALKRFITEWLGRRGKKITSPSLETIVLRHHGDLELLVRELEKLENYVGEEREITPEDVETIMVFPEENSIFELTDAVGTKKASRALWFLRRMLQAGESPIYILIMLARQLRLILHGVVLAEAGYSQSQIISKIKAHPYAIKKALSQARNHNKQELVFALEKVLATDVAIKTGQGEPAALLEKVVLELCS